MSSTKNFDNCMIHANNESVHSFYRAMHFSAKRGLAIACRLSVRLWRWWIVIT